MNYGPLSKAIEDLVRHLSEFKQQKDDAEIRIWNKNRLKKWDAIQIAQDEFYKDVKSGKLISTDLDSELERL